MSAAAPLPLTPPSFLAVLAFACASLTLSMIILISGVAPRERPRTLPPTLAADAERTVAPRRRSRRGDARRGRCAALQFVVLRCAAGWVLVYKLILVRLSLVQEVLGLKESKGDVAAVPSSTTTHGSVARATS
jgi:hypothetical protein